MGDFPSVLRPPMRVITPWSMESLGQQIHVNNPSAVVASTTLTQNQAYYFPFRLDIGATAVKMFALIGATANGNIDVGLYDSEFNYLISSGATAQGTINVLQEFDITDTYLPPGSYWMGLSLSSATGTVFAVTSLADEISVAAEPAYQQASAHPLPTSSATPVITTESLVFTAIAFGVSFDTLI